MEQLSGEAVPSFSRASIYFTNHGQCSGAESPLPPGEGAQGGVRAGMEVRPVLPSPNPLPEGEGCPCLNNDPDLSGMLMPFQGGVGVVRKGAKPPYKCSRSAPF